MSKRISTLSESPCWQCGKQEECIEKIERSPKLMEIMECVMGDAEFDYHECSLWKCLTIGERGNEVVW